MKFPTIRMQRLRANPSIRTLVAETHLQASDFIMPIFVKEGISDPLPISSLPGISQHSLKSLLKEVERSVNVGIPAVLLFGIPSSKDEHGSSSHEPNGIIQSAIRLIKKQFPHLIVIADCCLCEYTSHGHCGIMEEGKLCNDKTLEVLQKVALSYAHSGVDIIAPSGMMDGKVSALRGALDYEGFDSTLIMSYAVKFASCFYGPFREAAGSKDFFKGNRRHHMLAPTQRKEALREVSLDIQEGADILIVKPAMPYLDLIYQVSTTHPLPLAAYHVSGEYAMLKHGAAQGAFNEYDAFYESYISLKRAGVDMIISYYSVEMATQLGKNP